MTTTTEALPREPTCPVCFEDLSPPFYTCENRHGTCKTCFLKLSKCPTCRNVWKVNCRVHPSCEEIVYFRDVKLHEENCIYRTIKCPRERQGCSWLGPKVRLGKHFVRKHL